MNYRFIALIAILSVISGVNSTAQSYENAKHHQCLKCHSNSTYTFLNSVKGLEEKRLMNPYFILDTVAMSNSVHKQFDCTDCHSSEYVTYPHNGNLKLEPLNSCLDCHGGDESYAKYQFEKIETEFKKSVHYEIYGDNFTCSKCHNQHTYAATARNSSTVKDIVEFSNQMCLSCHNDMKKYQLVSGHENPKLVEIHNWLPNQELHFKNVRCIECHTEVIDSLMVSHNIMNKTKALKNCVECHSADSRLKASLYKYENLQKRSEDGSIFSVFSNESYVIGTHQSPLLQLLSFIIFIVVIAGIAIHSFFRIFKK
jgi:hypothetical protein